MMRLLLAVAAIALVATGCGAAENDPNLAAAAERTEAAGSSRIEIRGDNNDASGAEAFACEGEADYADKRVRVQCDYGREVVEFLAINRHVYLRFSGASSTGAKWYKERADDDDETSLANFSPHVLLSLLRDASSRTERIGDAEVRGVDTVEYRLTVDCDQARLGCDETSEVRVWIGDDGVVRRIELDDDDASGTIDFFDFGVDVEIREPEADQIVEGGGSTLTTGSSESGGLGPVTCAEGEAAPLTQRQVGDALRHQGFEVEDFGCLVGTAGDVRAKARATLGLVDCGVHATPPDGAPSSVVVRDAQPDVVRFSFENVVCELETDAAVRRVRVERMKVAFAELESLRP